jgi:hypothetical protein
MNLWALKSKAWKINKFLLMLALFFMLSVNLPGTSDADPYTSSSPAASLTIRVGYSGGSFTEAKVFTDSDFGGAFQQGYSFMDSMPSPCMDAVTGIPLKNLLSRAGIDFNKIESLSFYTTDVSGRPWKTLTKSFLFLSRYYYPNEMKYWNPDTHNFMAEDSVTDVTYKALEGAVPVEPMMCISDNWVRGGMAPDFSTQDSSTRYRLVIGQPYNDLTEITAPYAVKWVYQIDVTLSGKPPSSGGSSSGASTSAVSVSGVSLNKSSAIITVGGTEQLKALVAPSDADNQAVTWKSSDSSVAEVSGTGLVTAVAPGSARITVTTTDGGKSAVCAVTVNPAAVNDIANKTNNTPSVQKTSVALKDIAGHWAENSIKEMIDLGAVGGYPDGNFKPDESISRAEFVVVLTKTLKMPLQSAKVFADTKEHWAKEYVGAAVSYGIASGYDDNIFGPDDLITREQMAVMLVKAAKLAPATEVNRFADNNGISGWARDAVSTAAANGMMKGYPDNTFHPLAKATRAEAVTSILQVLK